MPMPCILIVEGSTQRVYQEVAACTQAEGAIEGTVDDYLMDGAFSTEFKYSRWAATLAEPRDVSKLMGAKKRSPVSLAGTSGDEVSSLDLTCN